VVEQTLGNWIKLHQAGALKGVSGSMAVTAEQIMTSAFFRSSALFD
jgi:hypothetical protein